MVQAAPRQAESFGSVVDKINREFNLTRGVDACQPSNNVFGGVRLQK